MLGRRSFLTTVPAALTAVAAPSVLRLHAARADTPAAIAMAYPSDVANWDPIATGQGVSASLHKCLFDMPVSFLPDLSPGPSVVERYCWLDDKGMTMELRLRDGVRFHNGDPLTSDDVRFSLQERPASEKALMISSLWGASRVKSVETPTPTTAVFHFVEPFVSAPSQLGSIPTYIMPRKYFEKVGREKFMENPIGSGPYRLADYQRNSRIVFEANESYWGGAARLKRVTVQIMPEASSRIAAIQAGQVDFASALPVRDAQRLGAMPGLAAAIHPINSAIMIQMVNKGVFKDQNVRLAMHHAIDKAAISKAFYGGFAKPISMWNSEGPANDPNFAMTYDPALAKALLAKSGYGPEKPVKLPFACINALFPNSFDLARTLAQMWRQVGVDVDLKVLEQPEYFELAHADKLETPVLYAWTNSSGDPELFSGLFMDPRKRNSVWKSDDIPPRLDPLLVELDDGKRMAGYREFDRWTVEQGYAFPLLLSPATVVHSQRIAYVPYRTGWALPYAWGPT